MTVKELKAISVSKVITLVPAEDAEYDIYHCHTQETYVFADDTADDREIKFVDADQDENSEYSIIYAYTK